MTDAPERINAALTDRIVQLDELKPHPENYNRHDIAKLKESLRVNGQYRAIVVDDSTGFILAGNGTWNAAKALGWRRIAAERVHVDETTARRILLVDNMAATDEYDDAALRALLAELGDDLTATGVDADDMSALMRRLEPPAEEAADTTSQLDQDGQHSVIVECDSGWQQSELVERLESEGYTCRLFTR